MHSGDSSKRELSTHRRTGITNKQRMADCVLNIAAPNPLLTARENLKPSHTILGRYVYVHS